MPAAAVAALISLAPGQAAAVIGYPGSGKTRSVVEASQGWQRRITFDPYGQLDAANWERGDRARHPWPGVLLSALDLAANPELLDDDAYQYVVHPSDERNGEKMGREFTRVADLAWYTGGNIHLVAEEAGLYQRQAAEVSKRIATGGAHAGISLTAISQRIGTLPIDFRASLTLLACGLQSEPIDQEALRQRCGPDFARQALSLPIGSPLLLWRAGYEGQSQPARPAKGKRK
jgi:hypothetical protein